MEFPVVFEKCQFCGSTDTICRQALKDEAVFPQDSDLPTDIKIISLQNLAGISTPSIKVLIRHYDTCAGCGMDRCVKVEKTTLPREVFMQMMGIGTMANRRS